MQENTPRRMRSSHQPSCDQRLGSSHKYLQDSKEHEQLHPSGLYLGLVFAGPVCWTGKKTKIELNPTAKDQTTGCSCTNSEKFQLPVAMFVEKLKNRRKPVYTGCNRSFVPSCAGTYSCTFFPDCRSLNHKKRSKNGWDMTKNIFICNSNVYIPSVFAISQPNLNRIAWNFNWSTGN